MCSAIRFITAVTGVLFLARPVVALESAQFWISKHGSPEIGSDTPLSGANVPTIERLPGSGTGSFYIWARPASGKVLQGWSLNVTSSDPSVIALKKSYVSTFNPVLNGPETGQNAIRRWEFVEEPSEVFDNGVTEELIPGKIYDLSGFTLFGTEGYGIGIGDFGGNLPSDPYYNRNTRSWLIARVDYEVGSESGQSEIHLEIGRQGMLHVGDLAPSDTCVVFGDANDNSICGDKDSRGIPSTNADAIFNVQTQISPLADFDGDHRTNIRDLKLFQVSFGISGDGDSDGDGDTDGRDFLAWQRQFDGEQGDFDGDGDVDGRDFLAWQRGESPAPFSVGDLTDWQENYRFVPSTLTEHIAVPEPSAFSLLAIAIVASWRRRRPFVRSTSAALGLAASVFAAWVVNT